MQCEEAVTQALTLLKSYIDNQKEVLSPQTVKNYLTLKYGLTTNEVFGVILLDYYNRLIAIEELAQGNFEKVSVSYRSLCKSVIDHNAAKVIIYHNHPSRTATFSEHDTELTKDIADIMQAIDSELIDHFLIAGDQCISYRETQ